MCVRHLLAVAAILLVGIAGFDVALHSLAIRKANAAGARIAPPVSPLLMGGD